MLPGIMDSNFLQTLRTHTDPEADEIASYFIQNNQLETLNRILFSLTHNGSKPEKAPENLTHFLTKTAELPQWIDYKKIRKAQELYLLYGLEISLILFCKSLPQSYCCPKGVKVLHSTGRLSNDPSFTKYSRRIMETSQFVMNVLTKGSFDKEGKAIITAQKVRLLHGSIRYYLKKHGWDNTTNGEPINQEDMLGTLISFSGLVIEGLEKMKITWTDEEKEALIHTWNVVGYILGVDPNYLPANYKEAIRLGHAIFDDQKGYSSEGQELTEALISFIHYIIPGNVFDGLAESMVYFFLGPENSSYVGLKPDDSFLHKKLPLIYKVLGKASDTLKDNSALIRGVARPFSKLMLQGILLTYNDHKEATILIPPSLQKNWELKTGWKDTFACPDVFGRRLAIQKKINTLN
ncbi:DUF2236 domain-containing protein [Segetibacter sp. 3557_3]|uniref:oxygenase MpaB family protein n=1 Tax=Segetibacter sp. 3557_3 TaxID=2547429 RepID=UPI001058FFE1|nr:oxygenase MpaB family protein [Segetibacter sp. 3557_3]TDH17923.1 DUF2236 domain-containing protein [Segetibacter sp. 3557_3]